MDLRIAYFSKVLKLTIPVVLCINDSNAKAEMKF